MNGDGHIKDGRGERERIVAECITACASCATAAEHCAAVCLRDEAAHRLGRLVLLARTCADVCVLTGRLLAQESEFVQEYCALCAEVCHTLRDECLKHPMSKCCRRCAEAALRCDRACQKAAV